MQLFELLTEEERKLGKVISAKRGETLFYENEECQNVGIVLKGRIVISVYTLSGQEIVYNTLENGGMFGNNLIFSDRPVYRGNVTATTESEIFIINKQNLVKILQNSAIFLENYLKLQANFARNLNVNVRILSLPSAKDRLLYYLEENPRLKFKSIADLARTLYLSRETLSRLITQLIADGYIKKIDNEIYLLK